ncbi:MAG: glycerol-3-phosphate dehydrogenase/oxidase [Propionibacteriaceae bacterium]|jgi:glycerol-3-phosphate dehydrogenase|nr:glycerol-3-phosphate dehydrogenase/oxidase [Propionibacteriaceae bacterium]
MVDIAIIGGGVNGLAIAREAASHGLDVVLLERNDIASGVTSASSHLIHCGIKYLENLEFSLVQESINEKRRLMRDAPHLTIEYPMLVPFFKGSRRPGALIRCGALLHDVMSRTHRSNGMSVRKITTAVPGIATRGLRGGVIFHDAQIVWPQRLCVELMLDAQSMGAQILTHTEVTGFLTKGNRVRGVTYVDTTGTTCNLEATLTINVTGPWIDEFLTGKIESPRLSGGTKGSHLVLAPFEGAPTIGLFFEAAQDGRPVFVLPWNGWYILGSTDITYDGDLDEVRIDSNEITYLLAEANRVFPDAKLSTDNVLYAYSGVRPLPYVGDVSRNSTISRDHSILDHGPTYPGLVTIIGGKLTTQRALGEDTVAKARTILGLPKHPSPTRQRCLPGANSADWNEYKRQFLNDSPLSAEVTTQLLHIYGIRAQRVLDLLPTTPISILKDPDDQVLAAEVTLAVQEENTTTLADLMLRRIPHRLGATPKDRIINLAATTMAALLGWDSTHVDHEVQAFRNEVALVHGLPDSSSDEPKDPGGE